MAQTPTDFRQTRRVIDQLDGWVLTLSRTLPDPVRVREPDGNFHWEYPEKSPRVVQMAKAVRLTSGIRAALILVDQALVSESASILRMVSDYSTEIIAVGEGMMRGKLTTAQQKFVDQFFAPIPGTPEEYAAQEKEFYVSREELMKSEVRLAHEASLDGEYLRILRRYLNKGYDSYVHGAYLTAMQLYHGGIKAFKTRGAADDRNGILAGKRAVAGKLLEVIAALELMAILWGLSQLKDELRTARHELTRSREQSRLGPS